MKREPHGGVIFLTITLRLMPSITLRLSKEKELTDDC
jgi:hypothetical protein